MQPLPANAGALGRWSWEGNSMALSTEAFEMKICFLLWLLLCIYPFLHSPSPTKGMEIYFSYAFLVTLLSKRHWILWIVAYSHFLHYIHAIFLFSTVEQKKRSERMTVHAKEKRASRQKDPSRPKGSPTQQRQIFFEKQVLHQDIFMSLWKHKGFSTQRIWLLIIKSYKNGAGNWCNDVWQPPPALCLLQKLD